MPHVCPLVEPALRATCEEALAVWWLGAYPSLLPLDETYRTGVRGKATSLPGFSAGKEILSNTDSLSWWEGELSVTFISHFYSKLPEEFFCS